MMKRNTLRSVCCGLSLLLPVAATHAAAPEETVVSRFLRYVQIDSQSSEHSNTVPTTETQREFARQLANELTAMGVNDVRLSEYGFVYALLPSNQPKDKHIQAFGLIAHLDTSSDAPGRGVKPMIHKNYQGGDLVLPADPTQVIPAADLSRLIGDDIITADGTTLLGSDDKAGVAAIMTLVDILLKDPSIPHGDIAIAFTPDEETSVGIEKFDVANFGAKIAYTVDGGELGEITNETWSAREAHIRFLGKSAHPGSAKGAMVNSAYALAEFVAAIPVDIRPENTEDRQGFIHPEGATMSTAESSLHLLLRDFTEAGLDAQADLIGKLGAAVEQKYPGIKVEIDIAKNYSNMVQVLREYPELIDNAKLAAKRAGVTAFTSASRGGTDGSSLSFMGLPCPDIFTGGHNFHSKLEFNSRQGLEKTTDTLINLAKVFVEQGK
ncbi:peptidase T [Shewanella sp.]|uniref:peptidase T n=1 Tax=Shewanella sp. TaxID=50422 RepID=UPI00356373FF